jgi:WD40 repeat protein
VAVQDIALVGPSRQFVAIAGRFNYLRVWDISADTLTQVPYPEGSQNQYVLDLATAEQAPWYLATADNQGRMTLWDLRPCLDASLDQQASCSQVDEWTLAGDRTPTSAIAMSENGCSIVTGSDAGRIDLWLLNENRKVLESRTLAQTRQPINTVDIIQLRDRLLIAAGDTNSRIHLFDVSNAEPDCP